MKRRVDWVPRNADGTYWSAYHGGFRRGFVMRLKTGVVQATAFGRSNCYEFTMRNAGKRVVAHINNLYPGRIL